MEKKIKIEREKKNSKAKMNTLSMYVEKIYIYSRIAKAGKELQEKQLNI